AAERERRLQERERLIEERRQEQARLDAEERKKEQERWGREGGRRGGPGGIRRDSAILVSQRTQNPREFFRQRERSGSTSGPALPGGPPGRCPHGGVGGCGGCRGSLLTPLPAGARRPFLRYQRSLTESAFIFRRPEPPQTPP
ncbi:DREB protein, partial [Tyrannus savana]|nr:DREB protein [Tyrannus savana]